MNNFSVGLGTAAIGRPLYINIQQNVREIFDLEIFKAKGIEVLETAYKKGIRYYDTAPGYGLAEELLADWIKTKKDQTIEVATKWGYVYTANFDPNASIHEVKDHSIEQLIQQWEVSKELLPNLSTLQIHSATFDTGVLENEAVLQKLAQIKKQYHIRIGVTTSGDNQVDVLRKALEIAVDNQPLFDVFQVTYNILEQSLATILDLIKKKGNRIIIKEGLANGRLLPNPNYPHYLKLYNVLEQLAAKYEIGVDAVALRFCIQTIEPFMVLSGASDSYQLEENWKLNNFELSEEEIKQLQSFRVQSTDYWLERKKLKWH
ncbi:aldo/keto reductase [Flavobacterium sp. 5]|uniref:aldo/keto reductase n=1 Tax=Flavobacterium sp. 5 TaxID=2035199 RepID=UPI000C2B716A|nr:aldo/keto reductase [Flavobacterium sp. 5]PKB17930.1 aryl-alcohol dehydrogenase-like predicted oxidoreductase [Flavobacterium sp. 5]